jgi:hypothetical protein
MFTYRTPKYGETRPEPLFEDFLARPALVGGTDGDSFLRFAG